MVVAKGILELAIPSLGYQSEAHWDKLTCVADAPRLARVNGATRICRSGNHNIIALSPVLNNWGPNLRQFPYTLRT